MLDSKSSGGFKLLILKGKDLQLIYNFANLGVFVCLRSLRLKIV